jgi:hypothetical protein
MNNTSEMINLLAKSLARFHATAPAIIKNAENPHYRNAYANLGGILDAIRTPLAEQGLSVLQLLGEMNLTTILLHESGQYIQTTTPLVVTKMDAQGFGSSVSYQRRYALSAILSLAALDDDGNAASAPAPAPRVPAKKFHNSPAPAEAPAAPKAEVDVHKVVNDLMTRDKVTDDQVFGFLYSKEAKIGDAEYIGDLPKAVCKRLAEVWDEVKAFTPVAA